MPSLETAAAAGVRFHDPTRSAQNFAQIAARVPPGVALAIPLLLAGVPDPDGALNLFERLSASVSPEVFREFDRRRELVHYALIIFGYSRYLGETLIRNSDLFHALQREGALDRAHSREEFREAWGRFHTRSFESDTSSLLARFKRREYVRIMLRDVLGIATLAEITAEISALADVLIEEALREAGSEFHKRYGTPQHRDTDGRLVRVPVAVLSLGKLGGNELNYSSDIDLLFVYGDGEDAGIVTISNREYFIRMAQAVTEILSRITPEGSVFRVDLRLRPQGGEGEPAVGLRHALEYYSHRAGDWERQALIKVRYSAGDLPLARRFVRGVQRFIYGTGEEGSPRRLNFAAIETALETRDRIGAHRRTARRAGTDVKLDRGGIRDIEFLVQCLQRVYGGSEPWLRSGGTLFSLQKLHDKGHISGRDFHELTTAYEFLRKLEHRLQMRHGQQTHRLPDQPWETEVVARSVGFEGAPEEFAAAVRQRMAAVAEIYRRIIHGEQLQQQQPHADSEFRLQSGEMGREHSERAMVQRLAQDAPDLHEVARAAPIGTVERRNLFRFLSAAFTGSDRYAAVIRAPVGVQRALEFFRLSDFLTDILLRHPEEVQTLQELSANLGAGDTGHLFETGAMEYSADAVFSYVSSAAVAYSEKLSLLRRHYRHRVFASGARDLMTGRNVFESLAETTAAADQAVQTAFAAIGTPPQFAVLALGRLGTCEFDLLSDADLVFIRAPELDLRQASKSAEQIMQALSAYTRDGTVFAVDTRLRPRGAEGELVITPEQMDAYFAQEAQPWEALSFSKLRYVTGSKDLGTRAVASLGTLLQRFAGDSAFPKSLREMRKRLESSDTPEINLKTSAGGMYDIDFIAGYLTVRARGEVTQTNIRERLRQLRDRGLLGPAECGLLDDAARFMRTLEHVIRLVTGRARKTLPVGEHARAATLELMTRLSGRDFAGGLEAELRRTMESTRALFGRIIA